MSSSTKRPRDDSDDDDAANDLAACRAKRARLTAELRAVTERIKQLEAVSGEQSSAPACPDCQATAMERTAKTEKNAGRKFWSCPQGCKSWIGWADATASAPIQPKTYPCERCKQRLTLASELELNMKRLRVPSFANDVRAQYGKELEESMERGSYVCEACLHNH